MSRALLKTGAATASALLGATAWLRQRARRNGAPTLLYHHRVVPDPGALSPGVPSMAISCETFEWQLDELARHYRFVSLDELDEPRRGEKPALAITFDDGYLDFYEHAFPILSRKGVPAAVFVVTDLVGTPEAPIHDRLYLALAELHRRDSLADLETAFRDIGIDPGLSDRARSGDLHGLFRALLTSLERARLDRLMAVLDQRVDPDDLGLERFRVMSWDMLAQLQREGIEIGSHTRSHALLTNESGARVRDEIYGSHRDLELRLGSPPAYFSYPDGRFDPVAVRTVVAAGYRKAFATCGCGCGFFPWMTVPRRHIAENELRGLRRPRARSMLESRTAGIFDLAQSCHLDHGVDPASAPSPSLVAAS